MSGPRKPSIPETTTTTTTTPHKKTEEHTSEYNLLKKFNEGKDAAYEETIKNLVSCTLAFNKNFEAYFGDHLQSYIDSNTIEAAFKGYVRQLDSADEDDPRKIAAENYHEALKKFEESFKIDPQNIVLKESYQDFKNDPITKRWITDRVQEYKHAPVSPSKTADPSSALVEAFNKKNYLDVVELLETNNTFIHKSLHLIIDDKPYDLTPLQALITYRKLKEIDQVLKLPQNKMTNNQLITVNPLSYATLYYRNASNDRERNTYKEIINKILVHLPDTLNDINYKYITDQKLHQDPEIYKHVQPYLDWQRNLMLNENLNQDFLKNFAKSKGLNESISPIQSMIATLTSQKGLMKNNELKEDKITALKDLQKSINEGKNIRSAIEKIKGNTRAMEGRGSKVKKLVQELEDYLKTYPYSYADPTSPSQKNTAQSNTPSTTPTIKRP